MIEDLCQKIWQREEFQNDRRSLVLSGMRISIGEKVENVDVESAQKLLQCAVNMAASESQSFRNAAYEIAVSTLKLSEELTRQGLDRSRLGEFSASILGRLGNFPSANYFENHFEVTGEDASEVVNTAQTLPSSLWMENESHREDNTVYISEQVPLTFTNFQKQLWLQLETRKSVTINAPTSAGKSFVLENFIARQFASDEIMIAVYVVPTRALIGQVVADFQDLRSRLNLEVYITEIPSVPEESEKTLYVLTQERLQILLDSYLGEIDFLIIDEAQNVADGSRGIILESVVERVRNRSANTVIHFGCPFTRNPEIFGSIFNIVEEDTLVADTTESPVLQNLLSVEIDKDHPRSLSVSKIFDLQEKRCISRLESETELVRDDQSFCQIAERFGRGSTNILYGSEPAKCEGLALIMQGILQERGVEPLDDEEIQQFSRFIKEHIHKDFLLAETIQYGIAYHYGKMPAFLRKGIEYLCSIGRIQFIICTSTLLQGVNLPAKNIFIMKPTKGINRETRDAIPLTATEFWNLSGRAGRLTKDFEGNIFLVDLDDWAFNPLSEDRRQTVQSAFSNYVCNGTRSLLEYIREPKIEEGDRESEGIESAFMKLYNDSRVQGTSQLLADYEDNLGDYLELIRTSLNEISGAITVPDEIAQRNPNISIYKQQKMLDYLVQRIKSKGPDYVIPPHPMRPFGDISQSYIQLFRRIHTHFVGLPGKNRSHMYYFVLALLWMKGLSYAELLANRIEFENARRKRGEANPNVEARGLFDDVETSLRFRYVKYTRCYCDLLAHALDISEHESKKESIPPVFLYLELGACSQTMMSLIGLGVSRTTSSVLLKYAPRTDMDPRSTRQWLSRTNITSFSLPGALESELRSLVV